MKKTELKHLLVLCGSLALIGTPLRAQSFGIATVYVDGAEQRVQRECGGSQACWLYQTGTVYVTVNGARATVSYGQNSTPSTIASALISTINGNGSYPVTASSSGGQYSQGVILTPRSCGASCAVSAGSTGSLPGQFPDGPSFSATVYGYAQFSPAYQVLSLLYAPPGNTSSNGYSSGTSRGVTSSVTNTFTRDVSLSFTLTFLGLTTNPSFGFGTATSDQTSFADTYSTTGSWALSSGRDVVDHSLDRFFLWLNPQVTVLQTGPGSGIYTVALPAGQQMDVLDFSVAELKNPSLISPPSKFKAQVIHGVASPGLGAVCANYVGDPACTASPCGCTANDFAGIVALDPLTAPTAPPVDPNHPNRFVYVDSRYLEGGPVSHGFTESDSVVTSTSTSKDVYYSTGYTRGAHINVIGYFSLGIQQQYTFRWDTTTSVGRSDGTTHTASVTFGSSTPSCAVWIDIYEDNVYHTFAFAQPAIDPCPSGLRAQTALSAAAEAFQAAGQAPVVALRGNVATSAGVPAPNRMVVVKLASGDVRRIYTNRHGDYALYSAPTGPVEISVDGQVTMDGIVSGRTIEANFVLP